MIKKVVQQGRSDFGARSVLLPVREHGKMATCLREAATAKAGNAADGFFHHSLLGTGEIILSFMSNCVASRAWRMIRVASACSCPSGVCILASPWA